MNTHQQHTTASDATLSQKTFSKQNTLPRLPIPRLDDTCKKFLEWVQPLLSEDEFARTRRLVEDFQQQGGEGETLQKALVDWSQRDQLVSWLEPFWDDLYLCFRAPVVFHVNPFYYLAEDLHTDQQLLPQTEQAAMLISSASKFKIRIDREELAVEMEREQPLCMMQFSRLFSTTRVPRKGRDELRSPQSKTNPTLAAATHVVVLCRGQVFTLDVLSVSGALRPVEDVKQDLDTIVMMAQKPVEDNEAIGLLTTMERDEWAEARDTLCADPPNADLLNVIETALFAVCLDESSPETLEDLSKILLHGDGRNRWFDKSIQFIVCQNGQFGANMEHSGLDGSTITSLGQFMYQDDGTLDGFETEAVPGNITRLTFSLRDEITRMLTKAARDFDQRADETQIKTLAFNEFGKTFIKTCKVSPDAFVQLALQLAQYKVFGTCHSTYEAVMTRRFYHGRTEAMRSVSAESVQFVKAMTSADLDAPTKAESLRQAAQTHVERMLECKAGQGVERHLYGLQQMYQRFGKECGIESEPAIFSDAGWRTLSHSTLSTSTAGSIGLTLAGFGPVVKDGFGIRYLSTNDRIYFNICYQDKNDDVLQRFVEHIRQSLAEMAAVL